MAGLLMAVSCVPSPGPGSGQFRGGARYVSLGDSWVSGPLIPNFVGSPIDCGRSDHNFPTLVSRMLAVDDFVDVSCGGAETEDLTDWQKATLGGKAPPQFDALSPDTTLVTIGIGGNDVGFSGVAIRCLNLVQVPLGPPPFGRPCVDGLTGDGVDAVTERIEKARPDIADAFQAITELAPNARVFVVGYPVALPDDGVGCWPRVPVLDPDVAFLRDKFVEMNAMIRQEAESAGHVFVDIYTTSIGHDVCRPPETAWVNGLTLDPPGLPLHPNIRSHAHTARVVSDAIASKG